ncbi:ExbD/TolR family protein [Acidihalobacter ferrooxydans]|uniref:Biopolymer transporter ExbD n=1 Tax=Acidihalobacter ferrooxydans TaxID=1765967 RepID=A0A1P8UDJ8_9GAMM|nr:biopolymer transporter ExbD [Acidihalobacter ferrooxydans]APZ41937.1 hypothetical protein BW247_01525 [Acidihalobacter ferrooxydans]
MDTTERRYLRKTEPRLNIIPMIDVMMFMLVFFVLIVLRSIPDQGLHFTLPQTDHAARMPQHSLVVNVAPGGIISLGGQHLTLAQLRTRLHARVTAGGSAPHVLIAGDRRVSLQRLVHVMSAISAAGIHDVGVAVRTTASGG